MTNISEDSHTPPVEKELDDIEFRDEIQRSVDSKLQTVLRGKDLSKNDILHLSTQVQDEVINEVISKHFNDNAVIPASIAKFIKNYVKSQTQVDCCAGAACKGGHIKHLFHKCTQCELNCHGTNTGCSYQWTKLPDGRVPNEDSLSDNTKENLETGRVCASCMPQCTIIEDLFGDSSPDDDNSTGDAATPPDQSNKSKAKPMESVAGYSVEKIAF